MTGLPPAPANQLTGGTDWARDDHAVSLVDAGGREAHRWTVPHTDAGLRDLLRRLARGGVGEVAIERPDGPVVDTLLDAALTVVVISPNQLKNLRGLRFLARFDCQDRADWLSPKRLAAWLGSVGYCGRVNPATLHARLVAAPRGATGPDGAARAPKRDQQNRGLTQGYSRVHPAVHRMLTARPSPSDRQITTVPVLPRLRRAAYEVSPRRHAPCKSADTNDYE